MVRVSQKRTQTQACTHTHEIIGDAFEVCPLTRYTKKEKTKMWKSAEALQTWIHLVHGRLVWFSY